MDMVYHWIKLNHPCLLCDTPVAADATLCPDCLQALPWIASPCPCCGRPLPEPVGTHGLCGACLHKPPHYHRSAIPFRYAPPLAHLIKQMKFHQRLDIARSLGDLLARYLSPGADSLPEVIVPVPLHPRRLRRRGYNQALELARPVAARLGLPIDTRLVRRQRATAEQSHLQLPQRRRNVRGAFTIDRPRAYRHVAIFDDVVTSGQTVNELARVLQMAGIERVDVWSCCRAIGGEE